jgi:hypothetical protein
MADIKNESEKKVWSTPTLSELDFKKTYGADSVDTGEDGHYVDPASGGVA